MKRAEVFTATRRARTGDRMIQTQCVRALDYGLLEMQRDALAAENARLREALKPLAGIPLEEFGWGQHRPDQPITGWNRHTLYVRDVFAARAALAPATKEGQV